MVQDLVHPQYHMCISVYVDYSLVKTTGTRFSRAALISSKSGCLWTSELPRREHAKMTGKLPASPKNSAGVQIQAIDDRGDVSNARPSEECS